MRNPELTRPSATVDQSFKHEENWIQCMVNGIIDEKTTQLLA